MDPSLRGLIPGGHVTIDKQIERIMTNVRGKDCDIEKYLYLRTLAHNCPSLYYSALSSHITELMPIVYTPTVGEACQKYSLHNPLTSSTPCTKTPTSGLYITLNDLGSVSSLLSNYPSTKISCVVITDGERILGLGDQGANGMPIPIGKLALYAACAGVRHEECMPITIDVGTDNEGCLRDDYYVGLKRKRERGPKYDELIDEVINEIKAKYGERTLIQFEDFGNSNAFRLLEKYRRNTTCFNDDIQGTASVVLGGIMASESITGIKLKDHKFVFLGAGEAGVGIADLIAHAIIEENPGFTIEEARRNIYLVDSKGLVKEGRGDLKEHKVPYAHAVEGEGETDTLLDCVKSLKPTAIIGVSAVPGAFTQSVIEAMSSNNPNPLIFALSNPTSKAECTAEEAYRYSGGRAVFASGSPFDPVTLDPEIQENKWGSGPSGRVFRYKSLRRVPGQGNNAYVFPGIGLGVIASKAEMVGDDDMYIAAKTLAGMVSKKRIKEGCLYPELERIREISTKIAIAVAENKVRKGMSDLGMGDVRQVIKSIQYVPEK